MFLKSDYYYHTMGIIGFLLTVHVKILKEKKKGYLKILFNWSSTSLPGNKGRPAFASSETRQNKQWGFIWFLKMHHMLDKTGSARQLITSFNPRFRASIFKPTAPPFSFLFLNLQHMKCVVAGSKAECKPSYTADTLIL